MRSVAYVTSYFDCKSYLMLLNMFSPKSAQFLVHEEINPVRRSADGAKRVWLGRRGEAPSLRVHQGGPWPEVPRF